MSPRTAEQFEDIRQRKKRIIMDAALKIFSEKGYRGTSISEIASESGTSKGLIYNYFKSKDDLLAEIMNEGYREIFGKFTLNKNLTPKENLMNLVNITFDIMDEMKEVFRVYFSIFMKKDIFNLLREEMNELSKPVMDDFTKLMSQLGFENPLAEAYFFRFILDGISINYLMFPEEFPKEYCINRFKEIYLTK